MENVKACSIDLSFAEIGYLREAAMRLQIDNDKENIYDSLALWSLYDKITDAYYDAKKHGWRWTGKGDDTEFNPDHRPEVLPLNAFPDAD